ncbi:MAG: GbsR/MarR family transcriptional regulator [Elusimicrobiota bacterium]
MASSLESDFAKFAGELAESFSFNRSIGQIYGLLYLSPAPLSLDDIAKKLSMSKGNASINLRALEAWGAVRPVWISGSRRDHYEADRDIKTVALRRAQEGLAKRLDFAEARFREMKSRVGSDNNGEFMRKQLKVLEQAMSGIRRGLQILPKIAAMLDWR